MPALQNVFHDLKTDLKIDWATHEAAKHAVENWHYSKCLPAGKLVKVGVWERGVFKGVVIFGRGANNNLGSPFGLTQVECCELVRIALRDHEAQVSRVVSIAIRFLKSHSLGLRLIVSYADPEQGHHGGIYQAGNWTYCGKSQAQQNVIHNGRVMHKRTADALFGTIKGMQKSKVLWKHKYIMPIDSDMRKQVTRLAKTFPKRAASETVDTPPDQGGKGGSIPTAALHS